MKYAMLVVAVFAVAACSARGGVTPPLPPEPSPAPAETARCPDPVVDAPQPIAAKGGSPLLRGRYEVRERERPIGAMPELIGEVQRDEWLHERTVFEFDGPTAAYRYTSAPLPEGGTADSTTNVCNVVARVPVLWHEAGFVVDRDGIAEAEARMIRRAEQPADARGQFDVDWKWKAVTCEVLFEAGNYRISDVSTAEVMGRPKEVVLVRDDEVLYRLVAVEADPDLQEQISDHFGRKQAEPAR